MSKRRPFMRTYDRIAPLRSRVEENGKLKMQVNCIDMEEHCEVTFQKHEYKNMDKVKHKFESLFYKKKESRYIFFLVQYGHPMYTFYVHKTLNQYFPKDRTVLYNL